jgi:hypothetical protein
MDAHQPQLGDLDEVLGDDAPEPTTPEPHRDEHRAGELVAEATCPAPGGCDSCPDPAHCRRLRVDGGLTTGLEEDDADVLKVARLAAATVLELETRVAELEAERERHLAALEAGGHLIEGAPDLVYTPFVPPATGVELLEGRALIGLAAPAIALTGAASRAITDLENRAGVQARHSDVILVATPHGRGRELREALERVLDRTHPFDDGMPAVQS